jgi:hypothetical protein
MDREVKGGARRRRMKSGILDGFKLLKKERHVTDSSHLANVIEATDITLSGAIELYNVLNVVTLLKGNPDVRSHPVADGILQLELMVVLTRRSIDKIATEFTDVLHGIALIFQTIWRKTTNRKLLSTMSNNSREKRRRRKREREKGGGGEALT